MSVALITGSSGLVGSEAVKFFCDKGFDVVGIDNNLREFWIHYRSKQTNRTVSVRNSYYQGILSAFDEKLEAAKDARYEAVDSKPSKLNRKLLKREERRVEQYMYYRHPRLQSVRRKLGKHISGSYQDGRVRGQDLEIYRGIQGTNKKKSPPGPVLRIGGSLA